MKPPFSIASSAKKIKYGEITEHCAAFFCARYRKATAVFASHDGKPATKDMKHLRRAEKHTSQEVLFVGNTISSLFKENFRFHHDIKANFVCLASKTLEQTDCNVIYTTGDANHDIAVTNVNESPWKVLMVTGKNTDLLILMLFYSWNSPSFKSNTPPWVIFKFL